MYCRNCGSNIDDGVAFCPHCGTKTTDIPAVAVTPQTENEDNICAILGFVFAFLFPIAGLILSIIGRRKTRYNGLATAGFIISLISVILTVVLLFALGIASCAAVNSEPSTYPYYYS